MTVYARPGTSGSAMSPVPLRQFHRRDWSLPGWRGVFREPDPVTGEGVLWRWQSTEADIEKADAAHTGRTGLGQDLTGRAGGGPGNKIADRIESNLETIALAESWDGNGNRSGRR